MLHQTLHLNSQQAQRDVKLLRATKDAASHQADVALALHRERQQALDRASNDSAQAAAAAFELQVERVKLQEETNWELRQIRASLQSGLEQTRDAVQDGLEKLGGRLDALGAKLLRELAIDDDAKRVANERENLFRLATAARRQGVPERDRDKALRDIDRVFGAMSAKMEDRVWHDLELFALVASIRAEGDGDLDGAAELYDRCRYIASLEQHPGAALGAALRLAQVRLRTAAPACQAEVVTALGDVEVYVDGAVKQGGLAKAQAVEVRRYIQARRHLLLARAAALNDDTDQVTSQVTLAARRWPISVRSLGNAAELAPFPDAVEAGIDRAEDIERAVLSELIVRAQAQVAAPPPSWLPASDAAALRERRAPPHDTIHRAAQLPPEADLLTLRATAVGVWRALHCAVDPDAVPPPDVAAWDPDHPPPAVTASAGFAGLGLQAALLARASRVQEVHKARTAERAALAERTARELAEQTMRARKSERADVNAAKSAWQPTEAEYTALLSEIERLRDSLVAANRVADTHGTWWGLARAGLAIAVAFGSLGVQLMAVSDLIKWLDEPLFFGMIPPAIFAALFTAIFAAMVADRALAPLAPGRQAQARARAAAAATRSAGQLSLDSMIKAHAATIADLATAPEHVRSAAMSGSAALRDLTAGGHQLASTLAELKPEARPPDPEAPSWAESAAEARDSAWMLAAATGTAVAVFALGFGGGPKLLLAVVLFLAATVGLTVGLTVAGSFVEPRTWTGAVLLRLVTPSLPAVALMAAAPTELSGAVGGFVVLGAVLYTATLGVAMRPDPPTKTL